MTQATSNLSLPFIQPNQAQKHVTHNEALQSLDALVQPVVIARDQTIPPSAPNEGDCHIVASGAADDWAGQDGNLAAFTSGGWFFHTPKLGWSAYVEADGEDVVFDGADWVARSEKAVEKLGINVNADDVNRLAVAAPASLLTHVGAGHQLKMNKATVTDTNSLLFQTGWSGRAEMGCVGSDEFSVKVSSDGTNFKEGLVVDPDTGAVRFPNGIAGTGSSAGGMGGQVVALVSEWSGTLTVGTTLSFGSSASNAAGPVLPFDAKLLSVTMSIAGGPAGNTALQLAVDSAADVQYEVAHVYSGAGLGTEILDLSSSPRQIPAGSAVSLLCSDTVGAQKVVATMFVSFN